MTWKFQVRSQDCVYGLAVSFEGRETAWNWLKVSTLLFHEILHCSNCFSNYYFQIRYLVLCGTVTCKDVA